MKNPLDLTGRSFLVTGASSGIGRETAVLLSQLGARVVMVGRNRERLDETLGRLSGNGHRREVFDLSQTEQIPAWFHSLCAAAGPLNGFVHSAGTQSTTPLRLLTSGVFEVMYGLNVIAAAMLANGFRQRGCRTSSGSIVLLSSIRGLVGEAAVSAYSASKAAIVGLTRSLAMELARENIRVNCVVPGLVRTAMMAPLFSTLSPEQLSTVEATHPLGVGEPRFIADAIAFLLADTASWITGSSLVVDGGFTAR